MALDLKDPKTILIAGISLAAVSAGGSMIGLTIEPQSVTDLRVEKAALEARLEMMENIVEDCSDLMKEARTRAETTR